MAEGLTVHGVSKAFAATPVLQAVSFAAQAGEFVTLLGPSGCGKTTLLRILGGFELADAGSVRLGRNDLLALPANRRPVNTVFQNYALFPHLSVQDNIAFGLRSRRLPESDVQRRVAGGLEMLRLGELALRMPHQLSGGQRQRVAGALALVNEPELLLLDEPMSALDAQLRAEVQLELKRLQRRLGTTFLLVTHDQDEAMLVSDRILVMNRGRIEQGGAPAEVFERPRTRFVADFLGDANLLPGTREGAVVRTELGLLRPGAVPGWTTGTLAIRPEQIGLELDKPQENAVASTISEVHYLGTRWDVYCAPGNLRVTLSPSEVDDIGGVSAGKSVWLDLPADDLLVLDD